MDLVGNSTVWWNLLTHRCPPALIFKGLPPGRGQCTSPALYSSMLCADYPAGPLVAALATYLSLLLLF